MRITDIKIRKLVPDGKMKAIVSVTMDDAFVVHDIKVVEATNGLFVAMPSRRTPTGEFRDIAHPITQAMREMLQSAVLAKYEEALAELAAAEPVPAGEAEMPAVPEEARAPEDAAE